MSASQLLLALTAAALKAGLLLALAAVLVAALRRAPARARHLIWAGALVGALLMPALAHWLPEWRVATLPLAWLSAESPAPAAGPTHREGRDRQARPGPAVPAATPPAAARLEETPVATPPNAPGLEVTSVTTPPNVPRPRPEVTSVAVAIVSRAWSRLGGIQPARWLLAVWLLGCLISLGWYLRAFLAAGRLARDAVAAGGSWRRHLAVARRLAGPRREVRLLVSPETATPMTWGWLRPVILLPERSSSWSEERRRIVLLHELVHVRRGDWLVRLVGRVVCSLYWLNPLAWLAARRLAIEQEIACDEEVVAHGTRASTYAGHLLAIARSIGPATRAPAHALDMARRSQMEGRLMSILDHRRRLRGGSKLTMLALLFLAGLIPALAAIEPWVEEEEPEPAGLSQPGQPAAQPAGRIAGDPTANVETANVKTANVETEALARVLGELAALDRQMEPFEAELESLEGEMRPIEGELEGVEVGMAPIEAELEGVEAELAPFAATLEGIEAEMEPYEARLEQIEAELEPYEERLGMVESEMEPFEDQLEAIETRLGPFEARLEGVEAELEPLVEELDRLSDELEPLTGDGGPASDAHRRISATMRQVSERMAPLLERMSATHEEMEPLFELMSEVHRQMEPLHQRLGAIHEEMAPVFERMAAVHEALEPLHERMSGVHEQMEPVFRRMGAAHERLGPFHEAMGEHHQRMEPYHRKMGEIHERMRPLHEEMGRRHEELKRQLEAVVERMLAKELVGVTAPGTNYAPAAARIAAAVSLRVEGGTLRVQSSAAELRDILRETLGGQSVVAAEPFAAAVERLVRAVGDLEVEAR